MSPVGDVIQPPAHGKVVQLPQAQLRFIEVKLPEPLAVGLAIIGCTLNGPKTHVLLCAFVTVKLNVSLVWYAAKLPTLKVNAVLFKAEFVVLPTPLILG